MINNSMAVILLAFILYLAGMVVVGFSSIRKNGSTAEFFLGGRSIGPWITALSAEASDSSAWLLMGLPGLCYLGGVKETFWTALGLIAGTYAAWLFIAKPLRKCTIAFGDSITIPEFFTNRFRDKSHLVSILSVVLIIFFFTIYTASGFVACAKLFNSVFGLDYHIGLIIGMIVILSYTITGGYRAVCTTDFIQGTLIFVAFVISSILIIIALGGPGDAIAWASDFSRRAMSGEFGEEMKTKFLSNQSFGFMSIVSAMAWGLGYFGMPHIIVRFMGIRSNKDITKARRIGISWMIISYIGTFIIGTLGTVYLLPMLLHGGSAETVFSECMLRMYPAFIAGIFLCAILAASMSTADSQLLSAASAFGRDIYKDILEKDADEKAVLFISRITVLAIAGVAFVLSLDPNSCIFGLVSYAWAGFGATFGPIILLALNWRGMTRNGAFAGLLAGGIVVVLWHNLSPAIHPIFALYEIVPGFIACMLFSVVFSKLTLNKDPEMLAQFDKYKKMED
ncbi:MAG: sodium/proline symporter PutP [Spirochaetia bacterium]|nr:sodium/proline symporter PutP [Spirochaetia bacterium]